MIDNLLGGDDEDEAPDDSGGDDMDGGLFDAEEGGDDDLMGGGDDLMGGGDDMGFDDMDSEGSATSAEMDNRIEELENEVASLSSTVNTVKSENEQISDSVNDIEENVRKLLEVYEMVTRGVNPFVDENELGDAFGGGDSGSGGGSMGLFDDDESEQADVDDEVANADAGDFFDDDLDDEFDDGGDDFDDFDDDLDESGDDDGDDFDDFDDGDDFEDFDDGSDDGGDDFGDDLDDGFDNDLDDGDGDGDGGKSFEELKAEYDSGEADWDDDSADADTDDAEDELEEDGLGGETEDAIAGDGIDDTEDTFGQADAPDDGAGGPDSFEDTASAAAAGAGVDADDGSPIDGGKPYLGSLPTGYVADIVVMDWLEFLVEEAGVDGAARTIAYYEAIEWLDGEAAETLQTFLNGFGEDITTDPEPRSSLTVEHHNRSLRFISRIANPNMEMVAFDERSGRDGAGRQSAARRPPDGSFVSRTDGRHPPADSRDIRSDSRGIQSDGGRDITGGRRVGRSEPPADDEGFRWGDGRTE